LEAHTSALEENKGLKEALAASQSTKIDQFTTSVLIKEIIKRLKK